MNIESLKFAIWSSIPVIILALFYAVSRIGLTSLHVGCVFLFSGIALLLLNLPTVIHSQTTRTKGLVNAWWGNEILLTAYAVVVIVGLSYLPIPYISYILAIGGFLTLLSNLFQLAKQFSGRLIFDFLLITIFAVWLASVCWQGYYLSPLFIESIDLTEINESSLDPLFHISIAQVIKNYGVVSNGLHILQPLKYHVLSHYIMARLSSLTDVHLVFTYNIGYVLIFPALLLKFLLTTCNGLSSYLKVPSGNSQLLLSLLIIGLTSILPMTIFNSLAVRTWIGNNSHFLSESYLISLLLFLCVMYTTLQINIRDKHLKYYLFLFLPVFLALMTIAKVSTGCLMITALGYIVLRFKLYTNLSICLGGILTIVLFVVSVSSVFMPDTANGEFYWMHFFQNFVQARFITFIALFYFWPLLVLLIFLLLYVKRNRSTKLNLPLEKPLIILETILILSFIGFIPGLFIEIGGGSAIYFAEIQRWVAIIAVVALIPLAITEFRIHPYILRSFQIGVILVLGFNTAYFSATALRHNLLVRSYYTQPDKVDNVKDINTHNLLQDPGFYADVFSGQLIDSISEKVSKNATYGTLVSLMDLDKIEHEDKLIYIQDYSFFSDRFTCFHYFHFIPAFSGFAAFQGVDSWCIGDGYFFDRGDVKRSEYNAQAFCEIMSKSDIRYLYKYNLFRRQYEVIDCKDGTHKDIL